MATAEVLTTDDEARWRELFPAGNSVFGSVEFARVQQRHGGGEARLFTLPTPTGPVVYPLMLRPVDELPFADGIGAGLFDAATPQYSGPFAPDRPDEGTPAAFEAAMSEWCAGAGVVTEFAHLQPWKARTELLDGAHLEPDREIVHVDLTQDPERMWRESYTHACRKNVKRAEREGVRVLAGNGAAEARELHRIYEQTMDRQGAGSSYYFPAAYFQDLVTELPESSRIVLAKHEDRVIAATLYLYDGADVYSYLGGADHDYQHLRPTNAVVHEAIRWARAEGRERLVLGGGYEPGDGIFRFKASFSPLRAELRLYRRVRMADAYESLRAAWREHGGSEEGPGFFPPYRAAA